MPKAVKILLIATAALLALLLGALAIFAATFDPNAYKPLLVRMVQEKTQRTLTIPGEIKLSFFPNIGVELGKLTLSERNSSETFAAVEQARLSLALLPLLSKNFVVDRIRVDGLRATIRRSADGQGNVDDLVKGEDRESGKGGQAAFDIGGLDINDANLVVDDRQQKRRIELVGLDLEAGRIASGVRSNLQLSTGIRATEPQVDAKLSAKSGFMLDLEGKRYVLNGLDAELKGSALGLTDLVAKLDGDFDLKPADKRVVLKGVRLNADGKRAGQPAELTLDLPQLAVTDTEVRSGKLNGTLALTEAQRTLRLRFEAPAFEGSPRAFRLPQLTLDAEAKGGELDAKAKLAGAIAGDIDKLQFSSPQLTLALDGRQGKQAIAGNLSTPLNADLKAQTLTLPNIVAAFTLPNPGGGTLQLKAGGNAQAHLGKQNALLNLKGSVDESNFDAKLGLAKFSPRAYTFDITFDKLDLDRYRARPAAGKSEDRQSPAAKAEDKPLDLSALKDLRANGSMRIGALKAADIRLSNLRFDLHAAGGRLAIEPLSASLYGGSVAGALGVHAANPAQFAVRQTLSNVQVGALLKDALGKQPMIEGRGNIKLDVTAAGGSFERIKRGLNGSARIELRDGAVHGINIAQVVRNAKARIGELRGDAPAQSGTAGAQEKTDFSELNGSFKIANGVAHNDDLDVKSPLLRIGGAGDIDLGAQRLDYLANVTIVSTLQGQGGPELQALKGLTVPVRLTGPFSAIGWHIDFAGIARGLAQKKLDEKKEEVRSKAQKAIDEQKGKLQEQLQNQLKGLFGK
jgi:AsmA protein